MTRPMPGLKLITLNTDMFYVRNYYNMLDTDQDDPSGLFHDLILELQDSEDRNERGTARTLYLSEGVQTFGGDVSQYADQIRHDC